MRFAELLEGIEDVTLYGGGAAKVDKLRKIITPEIYTKAYELMLKLAAKGMSAQDMDLLAAQLNDNVVDEDEKKFQFQLIVKGLPAEAKAEIKRDNDYRGDDTYVYGKLPDLIGYYHSLVAVPYAQHLNVRYMKGKWRVAVSKGVHDWSRKAFDTPEEALAFLVKEFPKRHKETEKTLAYLKAEKAKKAAK